MYKAGIATTIVTPSVASKAICFCFNDITHRNEGQLVVVSFFSSASKLISNRRLDIHSTTIERITNGGEILVFAKEILEGREAANKKPTVEFFRLPSQQ